MVNPTGQQEYVPLLPDLDADRSEVPPLKVAQWSGRAGVALANVGNSIRMKKVPAEDRSIDSIPDIWARPLLFESALLDETHPLHGRIRSEWRGLLTMLALRETRNLNMKVQSLEIPRPDQATSDFIRAAAHLCPTEHLAPDTSWRKIHVLFYGEEPIGMTSPNTLVCTAIDLKGRLDAQIPWVHEGLLQDPCDYLSFKERGLLSNWLLTLRDSLGEYPDIAATKSQKRILGRLNRQLGDFSTKLDSSPLPQELSNRSLGLTTGLYRLLDKPLKAREISIEESAVRLVPSPGYSPAVQLLILDPGLAGVWGIKPSEVPVYGRQVLAGVPFANLGQDRSQLGIENLRGIAQWRTAPMLFTDRLLLITSTSPFENIREVEGQKNLVYDQKSVVPILPIRSELLDYLSVEALADRVSFIQGRDYTITVELRLTLAGLEGEREFTVRRTYTGNDIDRRSSVPVLEVWPNFQSERWNTYYTYYDSTGQQQQDIFLARPHCGTPVSQSRYFEEGSDRREITRLDAPPTAMVCTALIGREIFEVGCLLLKSLRSVEPRALWHIGVDFGTSATHIFVRRGEKAEPQEMVLQDQLLPITPSRAAERANLTQFFLPPFEPETPLLTLFRSENSDEAEDEVFLRGNIRFILPGGVALDLNAEGVSSGFKWLDNQKGQRLTIGFLEQLAMQCAATAAAQGAGTIQWQVSFPSVFSRAAKIVLENTWESIASRHGSPPPIYLTESEAAARFFNEKDNVSLIETICIDIGGGTSDISVWGDSALLRQSSVKFAGESIFMDLLKARPDVIGLFGKRQWQRDLVTAAQGDNFYAEAGSVLRAIDRELFTELPKWLAQHINNPQDPVYRLIHLISLGTAGLLYYAGLLLRQIRHEDERKWPGENLPYVCIGGNGSRTFQWLGMGRPFNRGTMQNALFRDVLEAAAGLSGYDKFEIKISSRPKSEAAYGLVTASAQNLPRETNTTIELAAEVFLTAEGEAKTWSTRLTPELLASGLRAPQEFIELRHFVEAFNAYSKREESLARPINFVEVERDIRNQVQQRLNEFKGKEPSQVVVEPLFITALKALLRIETENWVKGR